MTWSQTPSPPSSTERHSNNCRLWGRGVPTKNMTRVAQPESSLLSLTLLALPVWRLSFPSLSSLSVALLEIEAPLKNVTALSQIKRDSGRRTGDRDGADMLSQTTASALLFSAQVTARQLTRSVEEGLRVPDDSQSFEEPRCIRRERRRLRGAPRVCTRA